MPGMNFFMSPTARNASSIAAFGTSFRIRRITMCVTTERSSSSVGVAAGFDRLQLDELALGEVGGAEAVAALGGIERQVRESFLHERELEAEPSLAAFDRPSVLSAHFTAHAPETEHRLIVRAQAVRAFDHVVASGLQTRT